jgi:hypothetical protein
MKLVSIIVIVLAFITFILGIRIVVDEIRDRKKIEIMDANEYLCEKYASKEVKENNDKKVNDFVDSHGFNSISVR